MGVSFGVGGRGWISPFLPLWSLPWRGMREGRNLQLQGDLGSKRWRRWSLCPLSWGYDLKVYEVPTHPFSHPQTLLYVLPQSPTHWVVCLHPGWRRRRGTGLGSWRAGLAASAAGRGERAQRAQFLLPGNVAFCSSTLRPDGLPCSW